MIRPIVFLLLTLGLLSCGGPEARRPVKVKTGSFIKASVERNRQLLAAEERMIQDIIAQDSTHTYLSSANGSWYYYEAQNAATDYFPKTDDLVVLTYNVVGFANDTLYTAQEIGPVRYKVDKQELFPGLRNSVKLLKEGETATFLFPSSMAYGYHGDAERIGTNVPIKSTISLLQIIKQTDSIQN